jgi:signal transduction histidine kinase
MRIRTQFIITMFIFCVVLVAISALVIITSKQVEKASEQDKNAGSVAQGADDLSYLSNDYLIYREKQQLSRWESRFTSFSTQLAGLSVDKPDQQALVRSIQANARRLKEVFDGVLSAARNSPEAENVTLDSAFLQVSWSRMAVQTQSLVSDASRLSRLLRAEMDQLSKTRSILMFAMIGAFGAFLVVIYIQIFGRTLKSIAALQAGTSIIGSGNLDFKIEEKKNDEIGDLSRAINQMTADLKTVTASKGDLEREIFERERAEEALRRARDELELRVQERTAELELRNKELQDFAFVASHDLQEPLRKVRTFGDMLADRGGASLDDTSRDYIRRMQVATARMQNLLNSLLSYSRVTTNVQPIRETDLGKSVEAALSNLEIVTKEKNSRVEVGDLPTVKADRVQMIQLFQNLIGNALKFSREGESPHVKIYAKEIRDASGANEICVEDNGIGFEERYLDKIFLPFQRLHGKSSEFEGVGMGLAICKKIVERHGGKITARSEFGKGSTFIVKLPTDRKTR